MKIADSRWKRFLGLMFRSEPQEMLFVFDKPEKHSFHTWFMRFPIDMMFLDENKRPVEIRENVRPWHFVKSKSKSTYVLELPAGTARKEINRILRRLRNYSSLSISPLPTT